MIVNKISHINFKENELSQEMISKDAILMLRDPNASIKFQQNQEIAQNADALSASPIKALGYKLYRTFSLLRGDEPVEIKIENTQRHIDTLA